MRFFKQVLLKITWLIIYIVFNVGLFFIEVSILFKKRTRSHKSNTGSETLDVLLDFGAGVLDALSGLTILIHGCFDVVIALVAFLLSIPVQFKYIKPNYETGSKKKFLFSLLASLSVLMLLKLMFYIWLFMDGYYM